MNREDAASHMGPVVLDDISSGARVVDVTDAPERLNGEMLRTLGDRIVMCFGGHIEWDCPLDVAPPGGHHGVVLEVLPRKLPTWRS